MSRPKVLLFLVCLVLALSSGVLADDYWPTWRGPQATGVALKSNPPVTWSEKANSHAASTKELTTSAQRSLSLHDFHIP